MAAKLGRLARTYVTLIACLLVTCIPSGLLHLTVCDCNGLLVESDADACPCEREPAPVCTESCCAEAHACGSEQDGDGQDDEDDSCCTDLPMPDLLGHQHGPDVDAPCDMGPEPEFGTSTLPKYDHITDGREIVRATGPPGAHRTRRVLMERASVVLLI